MTLIELEGLDHYTYVDTDGIVRNLTWDAIYDTEYGGGGIEGFDLVETNIVAWPWLHNYKQWWITANYHNYPDPPVGYDLPF
jgi:hypothetical protein